MSLLKSLEAVNSDLKLERRNILHHLYPWQFFYTIIYDVIFNAWNLLSTQASSCVSPFGKYIFKVWTGIDITFVVIYLYTIYEIFNFFIFNKAKALFSFWLWLSVLVPGSRFEQFTYYTSLIKISVEQNHKLKYWNYLENTFLIWSGSWFEFLNLHF